MEFSYRCSGDLTSHEIFVYIFDAVKMNRPLRLLNIWHLAKMPEDMELTGMASGCEVDPGMSGYRSSGDVLCLRSGQGQLFYIETAAWCYYDLSFIRSRRRNSKLNREDLKPVPLLTKPWLWSRSVIRHYDMGHQKFLSAARQRDITKL
jgi:hypothetical protein